MISLLKKAGSYIFGSVRGEPKIETIDIDSIIAAIEADEAVDDTKSEVTGSYKIDSVDSCQHRIGTITSLYTDYGMIDGTLYFDLRDAPAEKLRVGHRVSYLAFRRQENEEWKVRRIYCIQDENWEKCYESNGEVEEVSEVQSKDVMKRSIVCQVAQREGREVILMPKKIRCSLDEVSAEFTPLQGDWVVLDAVVEVNEEVCDFGGEVLCIEKICPLRSRILTGRITRWNQSGEGIIDQEVYFTRYSCEPGYMPRLGDKVIVEAIESEQGTLTWRALTTVPVFSHVTKTKAGQDISDLTQIPEEIEILLEDKRGIIVTACLNFGVVNLGEKRELVAEVTNTGTCSQSFVRGRFHSRRSESQFALHRPRDGELYVIHPGQTVEFHFSCKGRFIGNSRELFVFTFKGFKIGRNLQVEVQDPSQKCIAPSGNERKFNFCDAKQKAREMRRKTGMLISGVRPCKPPAFVPVRLGSFSIPDRLWQAVVGNDGDIQRFEDVEAAVENFAPCLISDLTTLNYNNCFHTLLYLEEIQAILNMRMYDLERVCFRLAGPGGEFLALEIPGLAEKRPSLLLGDRVIVSSPIAEDTGCFRFEGFIHKVFSSEIWIKFSSNFHSSYNGSEYNVSFHFSRTPMNRCHAAVNMAMTHLGPQMLFPTAVKVQPAQLHIEEEPLDEQASSEQMKEVRSCYKNSCVASNQCSPGSSPSTGGRTPPRMPVVERLFGLKISSNETYSNNNEDCQVPPCLSDISKRCNGNIEPVSKTSEVECADYMKEQKSTKNGLLIEPKIPDLQKRKLKWFNSCLNFHQKEAVRNILKGEARPLPYVIFGPPGTGKTMTLVEAVLQILTLLPDSRLLVATPSNSSADLVAERLLDSGLLIPGDLVRLVGYHCIEEGKVPEKLVPYCTTGDIRLLRDDASKPIPAGEPLKISSNAQTLGRHRITVGTCIALGQLYTMGFARGHFTHIFVDEAGQATEPEILVPLDFIHTSSGQVILAGDPLQLGPVVLSPLAAHMGLAESFLSRLLQRFPYQQDPQGFPKTSGYNPRLVTRLALNYRSVPEILSLPSSLFYDSYLQPQVSQTLGQEADLLASLVSELPQRSIEYGGPPPLVFHGVRGENHQEGESPSWFNPQEVVQALYYLNTLYSVGLTAQEVGVITPYKKQVQKLRILLEEFDVPIPKIGSVEEFQGQERKVIIMSAVRSSPTLLKTDVRHALGFVASPKRLNVALTRARALLIILGDPHLLARDPYWRSVLNYCVERSSYTGCDLPMEYGSLTLDDDL